MFNEYKENYEKSIITKFDLMEKYLTDCVCGVAKIYSYTLQYLNFYYKNCGMIELQGVYKTINNYSVCIKLDLDIDEVFKRMNYDSGFVIKVIEDYCLKRIFDKNRKSVIDEINRYEYKMSNKEWVNNDVHYRI
ncbi:TPA: hypothetical protein ACF2DD_002165 [Clostridium perfringens]